MSNPKSNTHIVLIGLVNLNEEKGDAQHFKSLSQYLNQHFKVSTISIEGYKLENNFGISYPSNSIYRQLYWNLKITHLIIYLKLFSNAKLVYMRAMGAVVLPLIIAKLIGMKVGVEVNGIIGEGYSNKVKLHKFLLKTYKFLLNRIDFINASSGYANHIIDLFRVNKAKVTFLTLGYTRLLNHYKKEDCLRFLELDKNKERLLFIGNVSEYQGMQYIIETCKYYKELFHEKKLEVLIVGDGPFLNALKKMVVDYKIEDLVIFRPRVNKDKLRKYLSIGAIGLSPFDYKRGVKKSISGLKTYDYLFHKMPIITSLMDDASDFLEEKELGWVIRDFNSGNIKDIILNAIGRDSRENIKAAYEKHYAYIELNFSWENRFKKISKKLDEIIKQK